MSLAAELGGTDMPNKARTLAISCVHTTAWIWRKLTRPKVRLSARCDTLCTSGLADDVIFTHNLRGKGDASRASTESDSLGAAPAGVGQSLMSTIPSLFKHINCTRLTIKNRKGHWKLRPMCCESTRPAEESLESVVRERESSYEYVKNRFYTASGSERVMDGDVCCFRTITLSSVRLVANSTVFTIRTRNKLLQYWQREAASQLPP